MSAPYQFRDTKQIEECGTALLARKRVEVTWGPEGPIGFLAPFDIDSSAQAQLLIFIAATLRHGHELVILEIMRPILGDHFEATRDLVAAAKTSAEAVEAWLARERAGRAVLGMIG